jgi:hypothetical protein
MVEATNINITLTGKSPWVLTYSGTDGTTISTTFTSVYSNTLYTSGNPYTSTISLSPSTTTTYSITALSDNLCVAQSNDLNATTATINVNARPTAVLSGATTTCAGDSHCIEYCINR